MTANPDVPVIKVDNKTELIDQLLDLRIKHDLNMTSSCTMRFADGNRKLVDTHLAKIGKPVVVTLKEQECFKGIIVEVGTEQNLDEPPTMLVRAMDASFVLGRQSFFRSFENGSYKTALEQVAKDAKGGGITGADLAASLTKFKPPYLVQEGTSLDFLEDVCARTGTRWHVRSGKLHVRDKPVVTHDLVSERDQSKQSPKLLVRNLNATYTAAPHAKAVEVRGWDQLTSKEVKGSEKWPAAKANGLAKLAEKPANKLTKDPLVLPAAAAASADEAKALAAAIAARVSSESTRVSGVLSDPGPKLLADDAVKLVGFGKCDGTYTLTRVEHRFGSGRQWVTTFWAGYRPPTVLGAPSVDGGEFIARRNQLDVGKVSDVDDKAGPTRVKVTFPTRDGKLVSAWARILGQGAGPSRGMLWVPEVGDEVLIGYLGGDARQPVVVGGLWTADDKSAPGKKADIVKNKKIASRRITSRTGSSIEFGDGDDDTTKHVRIGVTDKAMPSMRLGADKVDLEVASGKPVTIKAGSTTIVVDDKGSVTIEGKDIKLKATGDVTIEGTNVKISGKTSVKVDAGGSEVKLASGAAEMKSAGTTKVTGAKVALNG